MQQAPTVPSAGKRRESEDISKKVRDFLESGKSIQHCECTDRTKQSERFMLRRYPSARGT